MIIFTLLWLFANSFVVIIKKFLIGLDRDFFSYQKLYAAEYSFISSFVFFILYSIEIFFFLWNHLNFVTSVENTFYELFFKAPYLYFLLFPCELVISPAYYEHLYYSFKDLFQVFRDPRFESLCGSLDTDGWVICNLSFY